MGWDDRDIQSMIDYCIANEDGAARQCGIEKAGPYQCPWEGWVDGEQYKGALDQLPDWE